MKKRVLIAVFAIFGAFAATSGVVYADEPESSESSSEEVTEATEEVSSEESSEELTTEEAGVGGGGGSNIHVPRQVNPYDGNMNVDDIQYGDSTIGSILDHFLVTDENGRINTFLTGLAITIFGILLSCLLDAVYVLRSAIGSAK